MKKRMAAAIAVLCLAAALISPTSTRAAVIPYFVVANDILLPFEHGNMPYVRDGEIFVPREVFRNLGIWSFANAGRERARIYIGERHVTFFTQDGLTMDHNGNFLNWPTPFRIGARFYVPLRQVCGFFGLTYEIIDVGRDIIPEQQMQVIRIITDAIPAQDGARFIESNRDALRTAYYDYYGLPQGDADPPSPDADLPSTFGDVTLYLSFYGIGGDGLSGVLDAFDLPAMADYRACFFVRAGEIAGHADLIRRISGSGHTVGIWLDEGTPEEYRRASALLFEALKIKTLLISADESAEVAMETAQAHGLIFWAASQGFDPIMDGAGAALTDMFPTVGGERHNIIFDCSGEMASMMHGVLAFLSVNEYNVMRITETMAPVAAIIEQ